jgi:uncharacterized protein YecT (DUF1311 family)
MEHLQHERLPTVVTPRARRRWPRALAGALLALCAAGAAALDNPDAPDLVGQFQSRAQPYEARIDEASGSTQGTVQAYAAYGQFLDSELDKAYQSLRDRVAPTERPAIVAAQRKWLAWRDAEFRFIEANWTPARFGSSSALSRGAYRTGIVKARTVLLLQYLKNYGPGE